MILSDIVLIAALAVFVVAWWVRRTPKRRIVLVVAALVAVGAGLAGLAGDRWQDAVGGGVGLVLLGALGVTALKNRLLRKHETGVPFVTGVLVALLAAIPVLVVLSFPIRPLPRPSGQYAVGVRTFELADASRHGVLGDKPDAPRRLLVRVWYPAGDTSGHAIAPYFTAAETKTTARSLGELFNFPPFLTYLSHVRTNSYVDAPLAPDLKSLPAVIYSHGYTSYLGQNTVLMEHLASHGYVVFSLQHPRDSAATVFANGDVIPMDPALKTLGQDTDENGQPRQAAALAGTTLEARLEGAVAYQEYAARTHDRIATASTRAWVADRLFLHDTLQKSPPAAVADVVAAARLDRIGEIGMSFGGAVAGEVCMIDRRCAAGVNLDGGNYTFTAFDADVPAPFLMFHSDPRQLYQALKQPVPQGDPRSFNEFSYERIATAGSRPDVYRFWLKDAQHIGLSDYSLFIRGPLKDVLLGATPTPVLIGAQNDFVLGFFDKHMRNMANDFPAKELAAYKGWEAPMPNADVATWWNAKPDAERAAMEARITAVKQQYPDLAPAPAAPAR